MRVCSWRISAVPGRHPEGREWGCKRPTLRANPIIRPPAHRRWLRRERLSQVWRRAEASSYPLRDQARPFGSGLQLASVAQPVARPATKAASKEKQLRAPLAAARATEPGACSAVVAWRSRQEDRTGARPRRVTARPWLFELPRPYCSGRRQIQVPTMSAGTNGDADHGSGSRTSDIAELTANALSAARLPVREIAPVSRHNRIGGPNLGCLSNLCSSIGLLRAKQKAAKIRKGTVGSSGRTIPAPPSPSETKPTVKNSAFGKKNAPGNSCRQLSVL